jgi:alcohol dehydrogenase class IV
MFALKQFIHNLIIAIGRFLAPLVPQKVPVTFVGTNSTAQLCQAIGQTGTKKLLLVTDAMLVKLGIVERVTGALGEAGVEWCVYDGVEPDPTFAQVQTGVERFKSEQCDAVLAVGGGSSMDASKAIAAVASNDKPIEKLEGMFKLRKELMPLYALPTTAGTGSEASMVAVVSDSKAKAKKFIIDPKLYPSMTALDASLMTGVPPAITAATGMDALTHAIESYVSVSATDETRRLSRAAAKMVFDHLPTAFASGEDVEARGAMALASYYAGVAFTRASVGYVHAIAHQLGAYYKTPHGLANAIVLPRVLEFSKGPAAGRLAELADAIGIEGGSITEKADRFIEAVKELAATVDIPVVLDSLQRTDITPIAKRALSEAHANYPVPRYMSQDDCESLLGSLLD